MTCHARLPVPIMLASEGDRMNATKLLHHRTQLTPQEDKAAEALILSYVNRTHTKETNRVTVLLALHRLRLKIN